MPTTSTQEDLHTKSVFSLHIQPSILEGNFLYDSLYGKRKGFPLFRQAPLNLVKPQITGSLVIPALMKCEPGQWAGAPYPKFQYQWMSNGLDIPGATSQYWMSTTDYHDTEITVEVKGYSWLGENYAWTDPVTISVIETIDVNEVMYNFITGIGAEEVITIQNEKDIFLTGLGALNTSTILRGVGYFLTGLAADNRFDLNTSVYELITGIGAEEAETVLYTDLCAITHEVGTELEVGVPQKIRFLNTSADMGTEGWNVFGSVTTIDGGFDDVSVGRYFYGGYNALSLNIPYSYMDQEADLDTVWHTDIDAGTTHLELYWMQSSYERADQGNITVKFKNAGGTVIGSNSGPGLWAGTIFWIERKLDIAIPVGTRSIELTVEYNLINGNNNDAKIDYIRANIRKGDKQLSRDLGPDFDKWRVRFTLARAHSGGSFQELEFNDTVGGTDQATGGSTLAGSSGYGGDVNYLFDNVIDNGGVWAGELSAITNGTSWVGYDFISPFKPGEIVLTPNQGSAAADLPRKMVLEGSNDGYNWVSVQEYDNIEDPVASIPQAFEVLDGAFTYPMDGPDVSFVAQTQGKGYYNYGNRYILKARATINSLRIRCAVAGESYTLYLVRYDNSQTNGLITEILGQVSVTSTVGWQTGGITPVDLEVGDQVAIIAKCSINSGSMMKSDNINAVNSTPIYYYDGSWRDYNSTFGVGSQSNVSSLYLWLLDFSGEIF